MTATITILPRNYGTNQQVGFQRLADIEVEKYLPDYVIFEGSLYKSTGKVNLDLNRMMYEFVSSSILEGFPHKP